MSLDKETKIHPFDLVFSLNFIHFCQISFNSTQVGQNSCVDISTKCFPSLQLSDLLPLLDWSVRISKHQRILLLSSLDLWMTRPRLSPVICDPSISVNCDSHSRHLHSSSYYLSSFVCLYSTLFSLHSISVPVSTQSLSVPVFTDSVCLSVPVFTDSVCLFLFSPTLSVCSCFHRLCLSVPVFTDSVCLSVPVFTDSVCLFLFSPTLSVCSCFHWLCLSVCSCFHSLSLCLFLCPVSWGCRIHWLHLCRGVRPPLTSVLDMTLNNLMVRFQQCWSFEECRVPLHCHRSQVHSGPEW